MPAPKKTTETKTEDKPAPVKKELKSRLAKNTCLFEVYYEGGGELPKVLNSLYTTEAVAQRAIDAYKGNS
ncbi:hypothetical protein RIO-1_45 [Pseudoalteromonas phage RIO-1]|uniref:Uncharacterized protein n=1 Tax=Pseudoalteromonas phage RIO-1 TaxID=1316739 RepID=R4JKJ8_9CAUD|nr:hypothetical protein RIO-1_45 [Pseudoalteromonas phage RIO-1]AGK87059.1 hypothetical protein RIO-1_45 [Pseudoalteromonas phage RIO-1]